MTHYVIFKKGRLPNNNPTDECLFADQQGPQEVRKTMDI